MTRYTDSKPKKWSHPGGKLRELGADKLSDSELLSILIAPGIKGKPAEDTAADIINRFGSFKGMANQPLHKFLEIRGLAAAFEIARRIVNEVLKDHERV